MQGQFGLIGFIGGMRGFTQGLGNLYTTAPSFGLFLSYFFDLRFAMQFSFNTSDHAFHVTSVDGKQTANGTVGISNFALDMKYYINTQNVTKGLAKFNPYFIAGFARVDRTTHIDGLAPEESRAILNYLCEHSTREEFQVRFRWRPHSVAFWDNRCLQHQALWDYYPQTRSGRRVTIKGDRPF